LALTFLGRGDGYLKEAHPFFAVSSAISFRYVARNGKAGSPNLISEHSVPPIIAAFSQTIDSLRQFVG
jgi:hypothetical protein